MIILKVLSQPTAVTAHDPTTQPSSTGDEAGHTISPNTPMANITNCIRTIKEFANKSSTEALYIS